MLIIRWVSITASAVEPHHDLNTIAFKALESESSIQQLTARLGAKRGYDQLQDN